MGTTNIETVETTLTNPDTILQPNLTMAQARMKTQADEKRSDISFYIGDWVDLKQQPYRQLSAKNIPTQKLSNQCYGPFQIIEKVGPIVYKLDLPPSKIHPGFYISLLKPHKGNTTVSSTPSLPPNFLDNHPYQGPLASRLSNYQD